MTLWNAPVGAPDWIRNSDFSTIWAVVSKTTVALVQNCLEKVPGELLTHLRPNSAL